MNYLIDELPNGNAFTLKKVKKGSMLSAEVVN